MFDIRYFQYSLVMSVIPGHTFQFNFFDFLRLASVHLMHIITFINIFSYEKKSFYKISILSGSQI